MARITSSAFPLAREGEQYAVHVETTGGSGTRIYSVTEGELPPALAIDQTGWIRGTPKEVGVYGFTVSVSDTQGTVRKDFEICVLARLPVPRPNSLSAHQDPVSGALHLDSGRQTYIPALMCFASASVLGAIGAASTLGAGGIASLASIAGVAPAGMAAGGALPGVTGSLLAAHGFAKISSLYESVIKNVLRRSTAVAGAGGASTTDLAFDINDTIGRINFSYLEDVRHLEILTHGRPFLTEVDEGQVASGSQLSDIVREFINTHRIHPQRIHLDSCFSANGGRASQAQTIANELAIPTRGFKGKYYPDRPGVNVPKLFRPMSSSSAIRSYRALNNSLSQIARAELYAERGIRSSVVGLRSGFREFVGGGVII